MIYLDHNSTTPLDPRVLAKMLPWLQDKWGNASSRDHAFGWDARDAVEEARSEVAELIHAGPREIFFTSGATESLSMALRGLFPTRAAAQSGAFTSAVKPGALTAVANPGVLTSTVEHEAVL